MAGMIQEPGAELGPMLAKPLASAARTLAHMDARANGPFLEPVRRSPVPGLPPGVRCIGYRPGARRVLRSTGPCPCSRMAASGATIRLADLGRGPGRLTKALRVDLAQDGADLCAAGPLWLAATAQGVGGIGKSVRIGITREVERLWRFYESGNAHVSGVRKLRQ